MKVDSVHQNNTSNNLNNDIGMNPRMMNAGQPLAMLDKKSKHEESSLTELLMDDEDVTSSNKNQRYLIP